MDAGPDAAPAAPRFDAYISASCALSLAASLWALFAPGACGACEAVTLLTGGPLLPLLGVLWYGALLGLLQWRRALPVAALIISAGAGVHLALVGYMLLRRELCAPCLSAAAGALLMAGLLVALQSPALRLNRTVLALSLLLAGGTLAAVNTQSSYRLQRELQQALALAREYPAPEAGTALLVWYSRPDCERCAAFEDEVLPELQQAYGTAVRIEERRAAPGLPTPTVVVRGRTEFVLYPNPSLRRIRRAVDEASRK